MERATHIITTLGDIIMFLVREHGTQVQLKPDGRYTHNVFLHGMLIGTITRLEPGRYEWKERNSNG